MDSYVALGDSFTEGLDDRRPDGSFRGWADLVAAHLASGTPSFRYANLAVRGRRMAHVQEEQLPRAEAMRAGLATVAAGGNDVLGLRCDLPALGAAMDDLLARLTRVSPAVVVFTGFDAAGRLPLGRRLSVRVARYNTDIRASADRHGARVVDLWSLPGLDRAAMWSRDRLHLSADGHALVAGAVLRALGEDVPAGASPAPASAPGTGAAAWLAARQDDLDWATRHLAPWVGRKLRGRSTGDGLGPKRPDLLPL